MDIKRPLIVKPIWRRYWYVFPIALLLVTAGIVKRSLGNASFVADATEIRTAKVKQGEFLVRVAGNGVLKPKLSYWVSTQVSGRVEQIFVKPGDAVVEGQPLLKLSNPDLLREKERQAWELKATRAKANAETVALESHLLELENSVQEAEINYKSTRLKLDAETRLLKQGKASISMIDYERTKLSVDQQKQRWQAKQRSLAKMKLNLKANQSAQEALIGQVENNFQQVSQQVERLIVTANHSGIVQQISLDLGEQISIGQNLARIADQTSLIAELQIQELQIKDVVPGQKVIVDTRSSQIQGEVVRIDPAVTQGMVLVEVQLPVELPAEARPDLNVEAFIEISRLDNALFIQRPAFAPKHSTTELYQITQDGRFAQRRSVTLGQSSVNYIQIVSGLKAGDTIVISSTTDWLEHSEVLIN